VSEAGFALDARLAADTVLVGDAALCRVLLMDDARWPWLILVPRRVGLTELHELGGEDRTRLWAESAAVAEAMLAQTPPGKLNVAALGNVVAQLHLHHVLRQPGDPAWPGPVWGFGTRSPHPDAPAVAAAWRQRLAPLFA
jgi:diadenosine tetraphosphate (Ap4A) HIT family hydrolase